MNEDTSRLTSLIAAAERLLIFTGAGVSTGSGIPDYRGPQGIWKTRQPVMYADFMNSEAARVEYWSQKMADLADFDAAAPNAVHRAVARLQDADRLLMLVTQNIDGLHERAGVHRDRLVELHGTNSRVTCQSCDAEADLRASFEFFAREGACPRCAACGGFLKQATISFGQSLRPDDLERAARAAEGCDAVIAMGSTLSVYPAAEFPLLAARRGCPYAVINRGPTDHDGHPAVTLRLEGDVADIFPPAVEAALGR